MSDKICVFGCGFIGKAWAITFARAGHEVSLFDAADSASREALVFIGEAVDALAAGNLLRGRDAAAVLGRIRPAIRIEEALEGARHVQENTPEILSLKRDVFRRLDAAAGPQAVIASSSSALLPSAFTDGLEGAHRCLVAHPINPPHLVPAVEIVPSDRTSPEVVEATVALMRGIGQSPIVMRRELDGFVVNRLQGALLQEPFRLFADGYASAEDIDLAVRDGLGLRWSFMGPFETIDLNAPAGIADYIARYETMYAGMAGAQARRPDWTAAAAALEDEASRRRPRDRLATRQAWRDARLMALLSHRLQSEQDIGP